MPEAMPVPTTPAALRPWPRARWSAQAARLSRCLGASCRISMSLDEETAFLEVLPALPPAPWPPSDLDDAARYLALRCRDGDLLLGDGGIELLCLLGRVPLPVEGDAARARLRASLALTRMPAPLASLGLALAAVPGRTALASPPSPALVRQRLHARWQDVSTHCDAWADASVWDAILAQADPPAKPDHDVLERMPLRFAFTLGEACTTAASLRALGIGDVVRMPMWLDTGGEGTVELAGRRVALRCTPGQGAWRLEVLAIDGTSAPWLGHGALPAFSLRTCPRPPITSLMNIPLESSFPRPAPLGDIDGTPGATFATAASGAAASPDAIEALPMVLTAEVGVLTLSVGALRRLAPGMVLEVAPHGHCDVVLRVADGGRVAAGRLVDIDGRPGIQLTEIAPA